MAIYDIKTSPKADAWVDLQCAAYWELERAGTDKGLDFDQERHTFMAEGQYLPSVTWVLKREGLIPDLSRFVDSFYLLRGTFIHSATEYYDRGTLDEDTIDDEILPYLESYKKFKADFGPKIQHAEKRLYHPVYKYAGIIDRVIEGNTNYILLLTPGKSRPYDLKPVENMRGNLNVFLSALNVLKWRQQYLKEEE